MGQALLPDKCVQACNILRVFSNSREQDYKFAQISKIDAPLADSSKSTIEAYNQKVAEVSPYDGVPYNYENYTYLDTVICENKTRRRYFVNYSPLVKYTNDEHFEVFKSHLLKYYNSITSKMYDYEIMII